MSPISLFLHPGQPSVGPWSSMSFSLMGNLCFLLIGGTPSGILAGAGSSSLIGLILALISWLPLPSCGSHEVPFYHIQLAQVPSLSIRSFPSHRPNFNHPSSVPIIASFDSSLIPK